MVKETGRGWSTGTRQSTHLTLRASTTLVAKQATTAQLNRALESMALNRPRGVGAFSDCRFTAQLAEVYNFLASCSQ